MEEREPTVLTEVALQRFLQFNRDNWKELQWMRQVQNKFWKLYILEKEAEAELKYFTIKNP
jgi:hypothetical protein